MSIKYERNQIFLLEWSLDKHIPDSDPWLRKDVKDRPPFNLSGTATLRKMKEGGYAYAFPTQWKDPTGWCCILGSGHKSRLVCTCLPG